VESEFRVRGSSQTWESDFDLWPPWKEEAVVRTWRLLFVLMFTVASLLGQASARTAPQAVLFIGNSLTAANDLPGMVDAIGRARGAGVAHETIAVPNFSLEDHWQKGDAVRAIARGGWSTVILQQGPSALPASRVLLRDYVRKFDAEVRRVGARTALYMVWPAAARNDDFDAVHESYASAARDVGGLFLPAGDSWRAAWRRDRTLALYGDDKFHPSLLGSYLAALVVYAQLTGQPPAEIARAPLARSVLPILTLTNAEAIAIGDAAAEAVSAARQEAKGPRR
jgi:hypothetical protein